MGLTLTSPVTYADTVRVRYNRPSSNPLRGTNGIRVANFPYQAVTNDSPTPPALLSASVSNDRLTLTFDKTLDTGSTPAGSAFRVRATPSGGAARTIAGTGTVSVSGATVTVTLAGSVAAGETVTVRYAKPGTNPLRGTNGVEVESFTNEPVATAPGFSSATVNGTALTVTFDRNLATGSTPAGSAFSVSATPAGGTARTIAGTGTVSVSGATVTVTLASAVRERETVTVSYTRPATGATLQDPTGNEVATFADQTVTNDTPDTTAPTFESAAVNGTALTVTFDEALDEGSAPAGSAFTVSATPAGGTARTIAGSGTVSVSGATATVTLASAVANGETVTVGYTRPGTNPLRDAAGNEVATFSAQAVTNDTPVAKNLADVGEGCSQAACPDAPSGTATPGPAHGEITLTWTPASTGGTATDWIVYRRVSGTPGFSALLFSDPSKRSHTFTGLDVTKMYDVRVRARNGINLGDLAQANGVRPLDTTAPTFESAAVDGTALTVTFDEALDEGSAPAGSAFTVSATPAGGTARTIAGTGTVSVSGATATVTLAGAVAGGETVTVGYTRPGTNPLRDAAGNEVATFSAQAVTNNTGGGPVDNTAPTPGNAFVSALTGLAGGWRILIDFGEALDGDSRPSASAFSVSVASTARTPTTSISVSGRTVGFSFLSNPPTAGQAVTVSYTKPASNPLRDTAGNEVASFTSHAVTNAIGDTAAPTFSSAAVDGEVLTLTFNELLNWTSVPAPGAFHVTVTPAGGATGARRNVADEGVHIVGSTVELTLASAVANGDTVKVRYTKPTGEGASPLEDPAGNDVATFADKTVTNNTGGGASGTAGPGFRSASVSGNKLKMTFDEPLDEGSTPPGGSFRVTTTPEGGANGNGPRQRRSAQGPGGIGGTGTASVDGATVTVTLDRAVAPGARLTVSYVPPGENALRDPAGKAAAPFSRQPATNVAPAPAVTGVAVVSDPGDDDTYGLGETIRVRLTFGEAVTVDTAGGTPRMKIRMNLTWGEKWAAYEGGSGTNALTFAYTVRPVNATPHGVAVLANTLELDGGAIASAATGTAANLAHAGLGHDPEHKVDYRLSPPAADAAPAVTGVAVVSDPGDDDTYGAGEAIRVRLTFGEAVTVDTAGGTPRMKIRMNLTWGEKWAAYEGGSGTNALTFAYTVRPVNATPHGVAVLANTLQLNGGTLASAATGTAANLAHAGLGHDPKHKVDYRLSAADTTAPVPESATVNGRDVTVTFDEALVAVGADLHLLFTVTGGGVEQHPGRATASGKTVTMQLGTGSPARAGQSYTIGYFGGGSLRDAAGNAVARFSGLAAENLTLPVLTVADARADEGADAGLEFVVTLDAAVNEAVTVDYATADGSATAGEDYTAASGTLTFAAGERRKTVSVAILDDAIDEGEETFLFRLSNAKGARIGDGEATGTIANADPLQKMWLSRFGRTVAGHVTDAVSDRLGTPLEGAQVTVGGQSVDLAQAENGAALAQALTGLARALGAREAPGPEGEGAPGEWLGERGAGWNDPAAASAPRSMTGRELVLGSAFHLSADGEGAGPGLAAWGRVTVGGFDGEAPADDGSVRIDGDVTTGILGADAEWKRLLAGVAVSLSEGEGTFAQPGVDSGTIESTMTTVSPYARLSLTERVSAWGLAGFGTGDMTIVQAANDRGQPERITRTDLEMRLGAVGGRGALLEAGERGGMDLALKADAFWVETEAEAVSNEGSTTADASRVRLLLEGSRAFETGGGGTFTPGLELGLRHDGGDAETGTGVELGGRLSWADPDSGLSVEARVRTLIAHEDSGYEEWGASGAVRLAPGASGRGLSLSLSPTLGVASSGVERLWSARDAQGLGSSDGTFEPESRLDAELGYGLPAFGGGFTGTPNVGLGLSDAAREVRIGWRLTPAARGGSGFEVNLDATRREAANGNEPAEHGLMLRGAIRW